MVPLSRFAGLGTVPGFLIAGVAVGPSALSLIDNGAEIGHLAELGVVLLLFVIGIELKPSRLWLMRRMVFGLGTFQVVVTGALISAAVYFVFGVEPRAAILVGPALALSSTSGPFIAVTIRNNFNSDGNNCEITHSHNVQHGLSV